MRCCPLRLDLREYAKPYGHRVRKCRKCRSRDPRHSNPPISGTRVDPAIFRGLRAPWRTHDPRLSERVPPNVPGAGRRRTRKCLVTGHSFIRVHATHDCSILACSLVPKLVEGTANGAVKTGTACESVELDPGSQRRHAGPLVSTRTRRGMRWDEWRCA